MSRSFSLLSALLTLGFVVGCSDSNACGSGFESKAGTCVADAAAAGSAGSAGDAAAGAAAGSGGAAAGSGGAVGVAGASGNGFGDACQVHADCLSATNYCAKSPVDPAAYCTASGCDQDATICPDGWTCFNVGMFSPGEPYICAKPAN